MRNSNSSKVRDIVGGGPTHTSYTLEDFTTESEEDISDITDTDNVINEKEDISDIAVNKRQSYSSKDPSVSHTTSYSNSSTIEPQIQTPLFFSLKRIFKSIYDFMLDLK